MPCSVYFQLVIIRPSNSPNPQFTRPFHKWVSGHCPHAIPVLIVLVWTLEVKCNAVYVTGVASYVEQLTEREVILVVCRN